MRIALVLLLSLTGCSMVVHPNTRLLDADSGPNMGDAGPTMGDTGTSDTDTGASMSPDGGTDTGNVGTCGDHAIGSVAVVSHNDCGFAATQIEVTDMDCPHHMLSGHLTIVCKHMYRVVPLASDSMEIDCDGGTFFCATVLGADGSLTVECTSPGGSSCGLDF